MFWIGDNRHRGHEWHTELNRGGLGKSLCNELWEPPDPFLYRSLRMLVIDLYLLYRNYLEKLVHRHLNLEMPPKNSSFPNYPSMRLTGWQAQNLSLTHFQLPSKASLLPFLLNMCIQAKAFLKSWGKTENRTKGQEKKKEFAENIHNLRHTQKNPEIYYQYSEAREDIIFMK